MRRLITESGSEAGLAYALEGTVVTIGRSVSSTIQLVDRRMSRHHAEIRTNGSRLVLHDAESKNGTFLNGTRITEPVDLQHDDRIQVGDTVLRLDAPGLRGERAEHGSTSGSSGARASSSQKVEMVEEEGWGSMRGQRRAGYAPSETELEITSLKDLKDPERRLDILNQVSDAIRSVFDLDQLLDRIITLIQSVVRPDRTYLLLQNPTSGELQPAVVKVREESIPQEVRISMSIVRRCVEEQASFLVADAAADERFNEAESVIGQSIRTAMVAPLLFKSEALGVIYVDTRSRGEVFSEEELEMLTLIANQAAVAITTARLQGQLVEQHKLAREMEIARTIQMNLLPAVYPDLPGYQLSAMSLPAKQVGGDYYDFLEGAGGQLGLAIADVSGKGVPAAILTASTRSYLRSEVQHRSGSLAEIAARINRMVHRDVADDMYVTLFLGLLDKSEGVLEYVNAGHTHPVLLHSGGSLDHLAAGGIFLGIDPEVPYESASVRIPPGGTLVLYTDGVTDIQNPQGERFGQERFLRLLIKRQHLSAEEIRNAVYQACIRHRGFAEQFDDFTLIVLKRMDFNDSGLDW